LANDGGHHRSEQGLLLIVPKKLKTNKPHKHSHIEDICHPDKHNYWSNDIPVITEVGTINFGNQHNTDLQT